MLSIDKKCKNCGTKFSVAISYCKSLKKKRNLEVLFCSRKCSGENKKKNARRFLTQENINDIIDLYVNKKLGMPTIQKKYKTNQRVIQSVLEDNGVQLRSKQWVLKNRPPFKGHVFTDKQKDVIRKNAINAYIKDPTLKNRIRQKTLQQIADGRMPKCNTSIEKIMMAFLTEKQIPFEYQKVFGYWCYDFYLPRYKVFIECDGDYWHGHPDLYSMEMLNETQKNNIRRGKAKETYAKKRGYMVLRFWETDLTKNFDQVKLQLCNLLKIS